MVICTEAWPAKVMTSLIENPCSIQSDTAKWRRSCQRIFTPTSLQSLRNTFWIFVCCRIPPRGAGKTRPSSLFGQRSFQRRRALSTIGPAGMSRNPALDLGSPISL